MRPDTEEGEGFMGFCHGSNPLKLCRAPAGPATPDHSLFVSNQKAGINHVPMAYHQAKPQGGEKHA
jgi:hypothetical protein